MKANARLPAPPRHTPRSVFEVAIAEDIFAHSQQPEESSPFARCSDVRASHLRPAARTFLPGPAGRERLGPEDRSEKLWSVEAASDATEAMPRPRPCALLRTAVSLPAALALTAVDAVCLSCNSPADE